MTDRQKSIPKNICLTGAIQDRIVRCESKVGGIVVINC